MDGSPKMRLPFLAEPTRHYGMRWLVLPGQAGFWNFHEGCDWTRKAGTPVRAAESGVVIANFFTSLKGNQLHVRNILTGRTTKYNMLQEKPPLGIGSTVEEGDVIAKVGSSGTASTGPHLHFEVWVNGAHVDPFKYITGLNGGTAGGGGTTIPIPPTDPTEPPVPEIPEEEEEVQEIITMNPFMIYVDYTDGTRKWALVAFDLSKFVAIHTQSSANALNTRLNGGTDVNASAVKVARDEWNNFRAAAGLPLDPKL